MTLACGLFENLKADNIRITALNIFSEIKPENADDVAHRFWDIYNTEKAYWQPEVDYKK